MVGAVLWLRVPAVKRRLGDVVPPVWITRASMKRRLLGCNKGGKGWQGHPGDGYSPSHSPSIIVHTSQFAIFRNSRRPSLSACYHSISRATTYVKNFFLFPNWEIATGSEHPRLVSSRVSGTWLNLESLNQEWGEVAEPFPKHQPSIMGPFSLRT